MYEMFEAPTLTPAQIQNYRDIFINQIYNVKDLQQLDGALASEIIPILDKAVNDTLAPLAKRWEIALPDSVEILTTYGAGASYGAQNKRIIFRMFRKNIFNPKFAPPLLMHELIHLLIEEPIIKKYNVPQDLKERIVDIIGFEYFGIKVQERFKNSFANKYITRTAIENDLPGTIEKMMADYLNLSLRGSLSPRNDTLKPIHNPQSHHRNNAQVGQTVVGVAADCISEIFILGRNIGKTYTI